MSSCPAPECGREGHLLPFEVGHGDFVVTHVCPEGHGAWDALAEGRGLEVERMTPQAFDAFAAEQQQRANGWQPELGGDDEDGELVV